MSTLHDLEVSSEDAQPRLALHAWHGPTHYRVAQGDTDLVIELESYAAGPVDFGDLTISTETGKQERTFTLPLSHPLALRWMLQLLPPRRVYVETWLHQIDAQGSGTIKEWSGVIIGMVPSSKDGLAEFTSQSLLGTMYERSVPSVSTSRRCVHRLYDSMCRVPKQGSVNEIVTTAAVVSGSKITLASIGGKPDHWAQFGELIHVASGEAMPIQDQIGAVVTIKFPIPVMNTGDQIKVYRGCAHTMSACAAFANIPNYGGLPHLVMRSPFLQIRPQAMLGPSWDNGT